MNNKLLNYFDILEDPRKSKRKMHKLNDIIIMCIFAILSNCKDSTEIAYFLELRKDYFTKLLNLKYGTPSHDTISWVFRIINPNDFMNIFINWVKEIMQEKYKDKYKVIPIDGW